MISRINHNATDKLLGKEIDKFNGRLEKHQAAARDVDKPPEIDADAMLTIDAKQLTAEREKRQHGRLRIRQEAVGLARQWLELLEACSPEITEHAAEAQKTFDQVKAETADRLEACGLGLASQMASRNSRGFEHIAQRQFDFQLMQAEPVRAAETELKQAEHQRTHNLKQTAAAKSYVADALDQLTHFVHQTVKG